MHQVNAVPVYRYLAQRFREEGVDTIFILTGDGNMYWEAAFSEDPSTRSIHVRHEHCACAMATAYAQKTGDIGVASVTCGPGLTQITTALATAVRARIPLLVFAGEAPLRSPWYLQAIEQAPLVRATGAEYIAIHDVETLPRLVTETFYLVRTERRPVVLGIPMDLQQHLIDDGGIADGENALRVLPSHAPRYPHPDDVRRAVERIKASSRPLIVAGRGAADEAAVAACIELSERCDAALATTLPARGLFAGHPRDVGIVGGFAHVVTREVVKQSDLIIAVGASMTAYTTEDGLLIDPERVLHIDTNPSGMVDGRFVSSLSVAADAALGVRALLDELGPGPAGRAGTWDVAGFARRVRSEAADPRAYEIEPGTLDPRSVVAAFDTLLPRDWECVTASGHSGYFATQMLDRPASRFLTIREFGVVGNGLSYAAGVAVARPGVPVVMFEGDGGVMMHLQELETLRRYQLKVLVCVLNDGAYGSEVHRLRAAGLSVHGAIYGRNDIARMARGFGLAGMTIEALEDLPRAVETFAAGDGPMLLDIPISDRVMSPLMYRSLMT